MLLRKKYLEGKIRGQDISLIGMGFLAIGLILGQFVKGWLFGDFIEGLSVGLSVPLMMIGIYYGARRNHRNSIPVTE